MTKRPAEKTFREKYEMLKTEYDTLRKKVFERCPECGQVRFKNLFENAESAIAVLDSCGKTLFCNSSLSKVTGYDSLEIVGTPLAEILKPADNFESRKELQSILTSSVQPKNLNFSIVDKKQDSKFVQMRVTRVCADKTRPDNCLCIIDDVTQERENELHREQLIDELMEAKELQEDNSAQLAILLHELDSKNLELEKEIAYRRKAEEKLRESEERFKNLSITDQLTGLYNRRHMVAVASKEIVLNAQKGSQLSLLLMDIDDFKNFNDTYGHAAGDVVLERTGKIIRKTIRSTDKAFRYGGEEFVVILPATDGEDASKMAEAIREAIAAEDYYPAKNGIPVHKTISIGVAQYITGETFETLLKRADDNMYKSKIRGKNKVVFTCED